MINWMEMEAASAKFSAILKDEEIKAILRGKIDDVFKGNPHQLLFSFTGESFSELESIDGEKKLAESDPLQLLGLGIMEEYGLNRSVSRPTHDNINWTKDGITHDKDGYSREVRSYPSQTINHLTFQRTRRFNTSTGATHSISWQAKVEIPFPLISE